MTIFMIDPMTDLTTIPRIISMNIPMTKLLSSLMTGLLNKTMILTKLWKWWCQESFALMQCFEELLSRCPMQDHCYSLTNISLFFLLLFEFGGKLCSKRDIGIHKWFGQCSCWGPLVKHCNKLDIGLLLETFRRIQRPLLCEIGPSWRKT